MPKLCDAFLSHSQLLPQKAVGFALRGRPIRLLLSVKKYFCRVPDCPRKIFVERLPDLIAVSSRLTLRLRAAVQEIGLATCGKGGERFARKLGMPVTRYHAALVALSGAKPCGRTGSSGWH